MIVVLEPWSVRQGAACSYAEYVDVSVVPTVHYGFCIRTACCDLRKEAAVLRVVDVELHIERSTQHAFYQRIVYLETRNDAIAQHTVFRLGSHCYRVVDARILPL